MVYPLSSGHLTLAGPTPRGHPHPSTDFCLWQLWNQTAWSSNLGHVLTLGLQGKY